MRRINYSSAKARSGAGMRPLEAAGVVFENPDKRRAIIACAADYSNALGLGRTCTRETARNGPGSRQFRCFVTGRKFENGNWAGAPASNFQQSARPMQPLPLQRRRRYCLRQRPCLGLAGWAFAGPIDIHKSVWAGRRSRAAGSTDARRAAFIAAKGRAGRTPPCAFGRSACAKNIAAALMPSTKCGRPYAPSSRQCGSLQALGGALRPPRHLRPIQPAMWFA